MKYIKILTLCAALSVLAACDKSGAPDVVVNLAEIYGEWKLETWYGQSAEKGSVPAEVYLSFAKGGFFDLYQKLGSAGHYTAFSGTFGVGSDGLLYGNYSDRKPWGANYSFSVEDDRLTLENPDAAEQGVCVYVRTTIQDSVKKDAEDYGTKSFSADGIPAAACNAGTTAATLRL